MSSEADIFEPMRHEFRHDAFTRAIAATRHLGTPFVFVDEAQMRDNIVDRQAACNHARVALRPHIKTHKSSFIARLQLDAGAGGLTCASLSEAVGLAEAGISTDVFVSVPVYLDRSRAELAGQAAAKHDRLLLAVDSAAGMRAVHRAVNAFGADPNVGLMIEIDCGLARTGVTATEARALASESRLPVVGFFTHGGHSYSPGGAPKAAADEVEALAAVSGERPDRYILSAGSTPTTSLSSIAPVNEQRPGTYVFGDFQQVRIGEFPARRVAAGVIATVISRAGGRVILDSGAKILTKDRPSWLETYGHLPIAPDAQILSLYDNHAVVEGNGKWDPVVGERLVVIANHICPVVNLVDAVVLISGNDCTHVQVDLRQHLA